MKGAVGTKRVAEGYVHVEHIFFIGVWNFSDIFLRDVDPEGVVEEFLHGVGGIFFGEAMHHLTDKIHKTLTFFKLKN